MEVNIKKNEEPLQKLEEIKTEQIKEPLEISQEPLTKQSEKSEPEESGVNIEKESFLKETMKSERVENVQLKEQIKENISSVNVTETALVHKKPKQTGFLADIKQYGERQKKKKEAIKICPVGDGFTMDMFKAIHQQSENTSNAIADNKDLLNGMDTRTLKMFCRGYQKDKNGRPATIEDAEAKEIDRKFLVDYTSGDELKKERQLDRITDELINIPITPNILSDRNLTRNTEKVKDICDRLNNIENLKKINKDYFEKLPQWKKDLLDNLNNVVSLGLGTALNYCLYAKGISSQDNTLVGYNGKFIHNPQDALELQTRSKETPIDNEPNAQIKAGKKNQKEWVDMTMKSIEGYLKLKKTIPRQ